MLFNQQIVLQEDAYEAIIETLVQVTNEKLKRRL